MREDTELLGGGTIAATFRQQGTGGDFFGGAGSLPGRCYAALACLTTTCRT